MSSCGKKNLRQFKVAKWMPSDQAMLAKWLKELRAKIDSRKETCSRSTEILHAPVAALRDAILKDPEINMFFHQMFWQQKDNENAVGDELIWDWRTMIDMINFIMDTAPEYSDSALVGFPINAILNWPMATPAGFAAFLNDKVNLLFKNILNYWGDFLASPASAYVLTENPGGWFSEEALGVMPGFVDEFVCNPEEEHWGFKSWDDFFVRQYRTNVRPVEDKFDYDVICNACESAPFKLQRNLRMSDIFWIKAQRYSLSHLLNNSDYAEQFEGGQLYQAFLSALSYHRWHSPVSGTVVKTELVDGSYYSQTYNIQDDYASPNFSQGYITHVAARGIIYIQADNPKIGLMCFVSVGMSEVSTNEITVQEGDYIEKGQEIGMFHFGGSTHCLIFRPEVELDWHLGQKPGLDAHNINVRSKIATVK